MARTLKEEIKQSVPFVSLEEEALLNLIRTADALNSALQQMLKPRGLTTTQYNTLRILRGAGPEGLTCTELGERLVSRDPDITRLLHRLAKQRLVLRRRVSRDRRVVVTEITTEGLKQLEEITPALNALICALLRHMPAERLTLLVSLLEEARAFPSGVLAPETERQECVEVS